MKLNTTFYSKPFREIIQRIKNSQSFTVMGISDFGRSAFLNKLKDSNIDGKAIYVDIYELAEYSRINVWILLCQKLNCSVESGDTEEILIEKAQIALKKMLSSTTRVVIIMNRIDLVTFKIDQRFFDQLRALLSVEQSKINFIFGTCSSLVRVANKQVHGSDILFLSDIYYLPLYSPQDLFVLAADFGIRLPEKDILNQAVTLSGGHFQLFQLLLKKNFHHNDPLDDPFIMLALKNIYAHLTYTQRQIVQKISMNKTVSIDDDYLTQTGMITYGDKGYTFFSPLFARFVELQTKQKLPIKEKKLFQILKNNLQEIVSRERIMVSVWNTDADHATDWALDALVYRLRKNSYFQNSGYAIENYKKQGYMLVKK